MAAGNYGTGFLVGSKADRAPTNLMVTRSVPASNSSFGIKSNGAGATLWIGQTTVTGNGSGWQVFWCCFLQSYGNNQINGNAADPTQIHVVTSGSN